MYYFIYLFGVLVLCLFSVVVGPGYISLSALYSFIDAPILIFMLLTCLLSLFCTKLFKPFGQAVLFMFGKNELSRTASEQSLLAVKTVTTASIISGIALSAIGAINLMHNLTDPSLLGPGIGISILPLFYSAFTCMIFLPIQLALKKCVLSETI